MKLKQRIPWRRILSVFLVLVLFVPLLGETLTPLPASAVTQQAIDNLKKNAESLNKQKKELANQLSAIRSDKSKALEQKALLEQQINVIETEIDNINEQISTYDNLIEEKEAELADAEEKEAEQYELFCQRIRYMEEQGEVSYWSILFSSNDFSDLLDNIMMAEEIIEFDNRIMEALIALQEQITADKAALEQARSEQEQARQEQQAKKDELKAQQAEVDVLVSEIRSKESELEKAHQSLRAAAAAVDAEIKKMEQQLAPQISNVVSESGFRWPLPSGYNTLSSLFGGRIHPVTGRPNNHTGIDIPAPGGTSIYAAKSGVVTTSKYNSSYGNYVVISHSDGTSTLYAHMSRRNATVGQTVKQGAVIGYVGTTGSSTGNHLHLEIRVNGARKDPVNFFSGMTLYASSGGVKKRL